MKTEKPNLIINSDKFKGLTSSQVTEKLSTEGLNNLPSSNLKTFYLLHWKLSKNPCLYFWLRVVLCLVLGDLQEGLMLLGFVFVIMGIEFFQQKKTEKALDALKDMASPRALVIRNGAEIRIAGFEVVTDDLIVLQEGDRVPADATVLQSVSLLADESLLTGESVSVRKTDWNEIEKLTQPDGDDLPFIFAGSMIVQGNGIAQVTRIGVNTEIGKIGKELENINQPLMVRQYI